MSKVISLRLPDQQAEMLKRAARRLGRTPSDTGAALLDEGLRQMEFSGIEFRNSAVGRQAYVKGSRLAVWQVIVLQEEHKGDLAKVAKHLDWPQARVQAAVNYFEAFPEEIRAAIDDYRSIDSIALRRKLPQLELVRLKK